MKHIAPTRYEEDAGRKA